MKANAPAMEANMTNSTAWPDIEWLRKMLDFGGIIAYRVVFFDPVSFQIVKLGMTFNEDFAKSELEERLKTARYAYIEETMVKFNGAPLNA